MEKITKQIDSGYLNFESDCEQLECVFKKSFSKTVRWGCVITNYKTTKDFQRTFFDFDDDFEFQLKNIKIGDVINLREQQRTSNKYCDQFDGIYYVNSISNNEVEFLKFDTISQCIKHKNKLNNLTEQRTNKISNLKQKINN